MKEFTAGKNEDGMRLSRFVENVTSGMPQSLLYKSFRNKRVRVNGKHAKADARLQKGDVVQLYINDEFFAAKLASAKVPKHEAQKKRFPLRVIWEDENLAALYKPAHLLCHSDATGDVSLVDLFRDHCAERGEYNPDEEKTFAPAVCNRLDRGTEGLVLAAKNYASLRDMNAIIRDDLLKKEYLCITAGIPPRGRHTAWLRHFEAGNRVRVQKAPADGYKEIITDVTPLKTKGPYALCRIVLITGRTHQIRAHLSFLGAPVLGDVKYGSRKMNERAGLRTQALCAQRVTFGEIPQTSTLHYLSGRVIELAEPEIERLFDSL